MRRIATLLLGLVVLMGLFGGPVGAQMVPASGSSEEIATPPPSPNDVKEFLRLLGDPSVQAWLREGVAGETVQAEANAKPLREQIDARLAAIAIRMQALRLAYIMVPNLQSEINSEWNEALSKPQRVRTLTYILTFLLIGFGLEWLYRQYVRLPLLRIENAPKDRPLEKLVGAAMRAMLIFAGLVIFAIGSIGAFASFEWHPLVRGEVINFMAMVLVFRIIMAVSLFLQAPNAPELRLVPYDTPVARMMHGLVRVETLVVVLAVALSYSLARLKNLKAEDTDLALAALAQSVILATLVLVVTWGCIWIAFHRAQRLSETSLDIRFMRLWRGYLLVLVTAVFCLWLIGVFGLMWAVLVLGLVVPGIRVTKVWIDHFFDQSTAALRETHLAKFASVGSDFDEAGAGESGGDEIAVELPAFVDPHAAARPIVQHTARFVLLIGVIFALAAGWGINVSALAQDQTVIGHVLKLLVDCFVAILIADLVWTWAKTVIDKRLADYVRPVGSEAPGPEARLITLLPLLRTILLITLLTMVGLTVLTAIGVNIAPILAGAGILGIAIGFGTQSLVRDIVAGIFFLIDDAFRLGEYIEIGDLMGTVESISIRSMRIRHHRGKVHTVPYGELKSLTNHSRDWVIMKLEFRVPFDTDLGLVKKLVKKIGAELQQNEVYGKSILETLKSQGVRRMEEFNMVVGVKFMTKPGEQWLVRRDAYQMVRDTFEANGIRLAERNVKVQIAGGDHLTENERRVVAGAAQSTVEGPSGPPKAIPDEP
jgi:small-conductance mechanosensitive channel